MNNLAVLN